MRIASGIEQSAWIKKETTPGDMPDMTSDDTLPLIGDFIAKQERAFNESQEKLDTLGSIERNAFVYKVGDLSFLCHFRASGALGTAPEGGPVLEGVYGKETIDAGVDVRYQQRAKTEAIPTYSFIRRSGHEVWYITGGVLDSLARVIKAGEGLDSEYSGSVVGYFCKRSVAGYDSLSAAIDGTVTPVTVVPVRNSKRFIGTPKFYVGTDDNGGVGYDVGSIDYAAGEITLKDGQEISTAQAIDSIVAGWVPAIASAGYIIHGRFGKLQISHDGGSTYTDKVFTSEAKIDYKNNYKINNKLKTDEGYPAIAAISAGKREIDVSIAESFTEDLTIYEYDADQATNLKAKIPVGSVSTKISEVVIPNLQIDTPETSGGDEEMVRTITGKCYETVGTLNDAIEDIWK